MHDLRRLALAFAEAASTAGAAIMEVYAGDFAVRAKSDASPITLADERADEILRTELARLLPGVPLITEESFEAAALRRAAEPKARARVEDVDADSELARGPWLLVDPLDGTREFVSRNGEFTVNIALIDDRLPIAGCVFAPAIGEMYLGGVGAFHGRLPAGERVDPAVLQPIATREPPATGLVAAHSRSHHDAETAAFLSRLGVAETRSIGSSLKFCLVARGLADVYPRFGPTMEWDTAAGHAVLLAAGGDVLTPDGRPFLYGKVREGLCNGPFVAWSGTLASLHRAR